MGVGVAVSPDQVSIGVLVEAVPRDAVDEAVAVCGVRERRSDGKLPAHVVALAECGTHAFVAAEVAGYGIGEKTLAQRLYPRLRADELLTADRGFYSWAAWDTAAATGAGLLWRAPTQLTLPVVRVLPDGTYLSVVMDSKVRGTRRETIVAAARAGHDFADVDAALDEHGRPRARLVRVIEYDVPDRAGNGTGELVGAGVVGVGDAGQQHDELAGSVAGPVGHVVLDDPDQPGPWAAVLVEGGVDVGEIVAGSGCGHDRFAAGAADLGVHHDAEVGAVGQDPDDGQGELGRRPPQQAR